jgi:alanyl-tRNA synthetase
MDTSTAIRTFTEFFGDRGHQLIESSPLVPPGRDPVLFTTAGMHPLTRYLEGTPHPLGRRLAGVQRCLRTTDLDEVGDCSHLTVFQMLGSWSLGDYGGPQSLRWGLELICDGFGLRRDRLHATVFGGDEHAGPDTEALETWRELGVPVELTVEDNWWSNGPTGPCGPDSEIFAWTGDGPPSGSAMASGRPAPGGVTCSAGCCAARSPSCGAATGHEPWPTCRECWSKTPWPGSGSPCRPGSSRTSCWPTSASSAGC